jgi:hypothetical protein
VLERQRPQIDGRSGPFLARKAHRA